jgi:hypothetical protein
MISSPLCEAGGHGHRDPRIIRVGRSGPAIEALRSKLQRIFDSREEQNVPFMLADGFMKKSSALSFGSGEVAVGVIFPAALYVVSQYSFTLFHTIGELCSIGIGFSLFMLTWNSRRIIDNNQIHSERNDQ